MNMTTTTPAIQSVTFRIESAKVGKLDELAAATERDRSFHLNKAVDAYLAKRGKTQKVIDSLSSKNGSIPTIETKKAGAR